ncbi:MAG: hypothetical protein ACK4GN_14955 [Runella sp.]
MAQVFTPPPPSRTRTMLLCLLAATVIWLFNQLNKEDYKLQIDYPIAFTYNDSLYISVRPLPKSVSATLNGNGWALLRNSFSFTVEPVVYPLTNPLGTRTLNLATLSTLMNEQVKDVKISNLSLDNYLIDFEERTVKDVVLKIDSSAIDLSPRFVISSFINVRPNTVKFEGAASLIDDLPDTILIRIPSKKIRGNYDEELPIRYPQSPLLKASSSKVFVSFEVAELLK